MEVDRSRGSKGLDRGSSLPGDSSGVRCLLGEDIGGASSTSLMLRFPAKGVSMGWPDIGELSPTIFSDIRLFLDTELAGCSSSTWAMPLFLEGSASGMFVGDALVRCLARPAVCISVDCPLN